MMLLASIGLALATAPSAQLLTITGVSQPTAEVIPLQVTAGDLDGDGVADSGMLLLRCSGNAVSGAELHYNVKSPRDSASGQASGRRSHVVPHVFETSGPRLATLRPSYDLKKAQAARMTSRKGYDLYVALSLTSAEGLCTAAGEEAAKVKATKSRSNIQNN